MLNAIAAHVGRLSTVTCENDVLACAVKGLHQSCGARSFWTASSVWPHLTGCTLKTSLKLTKTYDLAWAGAASATEPDALCQVKIGRPGRQQDQEVLLFIGDLAFLALDQWLSGSPTREHFGLAAVHDSVIAKATHWGQMFALPSKSRLVLSPQTASTAYAFGGASQLINSQTGVVAPQTKSQYQKVFGAGTTAKFVGLFHRPGTVEVPLETSAVQTISGYQLLLIKVGIPALTGATPNHLEDWWP